MPEVKRGQWQKLDNGAAPMESSSLQAKERENTGDTSFSVMP